MAKIKTLEEAFQFVQDVDICTLFSVKAEGVVSLWESVDLPIDGGRTKWGARVEAIWQWKNELPARYPDDIFYGKLSGGLAVFMTVDYLREVHYRANWQPLEKCSALAQSVYEIIRRDNGTTAQIRKQAIAELGCTKSRFDTALRQLQISLNIARTCQPGATVDRWLPFRELFIDIANQQN